MTKDDNKALAGPVVQGPIEPADGMGLPLSCGKPLCSPGDHYPLCRLATPPAAQRKPLTHDEDNAICEANCNAEADAYFKARPQLDTTENRRIFYAGHRRAWLSYPCLAEATHDIKEKNT